MAEESGTPPSGGSIPKVILTNVTPVAGTPSFSQEPCAEISAHVSVIGDIPDVLFRYSKKEFLESFLSTGLICFDIFPRETVIIQNLVVVAHGSCRNCSQGMLASLAAQCEQIAGYAKAMQEVCFHRGF